MMADAISVPEDGRQSETALRIARGARRLLRAHGYATVAEMPLPSGRRADIVGLAPGGELLIVEIKSSIADFRADLKWPDYRLHCDRLYFAIPGDVPPGIMPEDAGLIIADAFGAEFMRPCPGAQTPRSHTAQHVAALRPFAADRLHALWDAGRGA